jgi:hypothetical protein
MDAEAHCEALGPKSPRSACCGSSPSWSMALVFLASGVATEFFMLGATEIRTYTVIIIYIYIYRVLI